MTQRQLRLLQQARQKLAAAKALLTMGFYEDAVSRAYYAMFYVAETFLDTAGLAFSSHAAVISELGRLFAKSGRIPPEFHRFLLEAQDVFPH